MRIENGILLNRHYHRARIDRSCRGCLEVEAPEDLLDIFIPEQYRRGTVKCRLLYGSDSDGLISRIEFAQYYRRKINSLRLVEGSPDYSYKYTDRSEIEALFAAREDCDDIIIVSQGLLTDASAANLVLVKDGRWYTPSKPLLEGTERARLLDEGIIEAADIKPEQLKDFDGIRLINAMLPFSRQPVIPVSAVKGV